MTSAQLVPAIVIPLILWRVYSRARRAIGRQPWRHGRLVTAVVLFSVITLLIGLGGWRSPTSLAALGGGLVLGIPLAIVALRLTRFESVADGKFYTPNATIGIAVTLLLVARIAYRIVVMLGTPPTAGVPPSFYQSPLTLLVFGVTAGYYIVYYAGVLNRGRKLA
jgi:cytochrome b561